MFDWNDLRAFLAVAREGSSMGAAKTLRVNQTTVARRIEALEAALGMKLFERGQAGSRLTEAGEAILADAEKVEAAAEGVARRVALLSRGMGGTIRLTASETMANLVLTPALVEFRRLYPEIAIELVITDQRLDIEAGEADIAIRGAAELPDSNLIVRKLHTDHFALYCSRGYAERHGAPASPADLNNHILVGGEGLMTGLPGMAWMMEHAPQGEVACRSNTLSNLMVSIQAGLGIGPMSCFLGDADPGLLRLFPPIVGSEGATWLVTRRDLKDTPRIRAFIDFLTSHMAGVRHELETRAAQMRAEKDETLAAHRSRVSSPA